MKPPIDVIEELGAAVQAGAIDRDTACAQLQSSCGLTLAGAADLIDNWKGARAGYTQELEAARCGLTSSLDRLYDNS